MPTASWKPGVSGMREHARGSWQRQRRHLPQLDKNAQEQILECVCAHTCVLVHVSMHTRQLCHLLQMRGEMQALRGSLDQPP